MSHLRLQSGQPGPSSTHQKYEDIATIAYNHGLHKLKEDCADDPKALRIIAELNLGTDPRDMIKKLQVQCKSNSKHNKNTLGWLSKISERVLFYSKVLDMLAQHHPEYVSLAWGSVKIVLTGIINYSELVEEFASAIVEIGDVLNDTKLDVTLHQTPRILQVNAKMYSEIMNFLVRAVKWSRRSTARRIVQAVLNPWTLEYKDILVNIRALSKTINDQAGSESRGEIREVRIDMRKMYDDFQDFVSQVQQHFGATDQRMDDILKAVIASKTITERVNHNVEDMRPKLYSIEAQLYTLVKQADDPDMLLRKAQAGYLRRRCNPGSQPSVRLVNTVTCWVQDPGTPLLILQASSRARLLAKDLGVTLISQLQQIKFNAIWALSSSNTESGMLNLEDVLKTLVLQIVARKPSATKTFPAPLRLDDECSRTLQEYKDLLYGLLCNLGDTFIVVEIPPSTRIDVFIEAIRDLYHIAERVWRMTGRTVKIMCMASGPNISASIPDLYIREPSMKVKPSIAMVQQPRPLPSRLRRIAAQSRRPRLVRALEGAC